MLHEEDKEIIPKLKDKTYREKLAESVCLYLLELKRNIPHRTVEALDILLSKIYEDYKNGKELKSAIIFTEGNYYQNIQPTKNDADGASLAYRLSLLGKMYYLYKAKSDGLEKRLDVGVSIDGGQIVFNFDGREKSCNYVLKSHYRYNHINDYTNLKGVAIKKAGRVCIEINRKKYNFGYSQENRYIIAVFTDKAPADKDKGIYFFDLKGKMMFEAFDSKETNEKRKMFKADEIEEKSKHFDPKEYSLEVTGGMKKWWANSQRPFLRKGLTAIVEGYIEHTTAREGILELGHYIKKNGKVQKKTHIPVGKGYPHEMVRAQFNGPYILIYTQDNQKLLNAHILGSLGFVHGGFIRFTENNNLHTISIREKDTKTGYIEIKLRENGRLYFYYFSKKNIEEATGGKLEDYARRAILIDKNKQEKPNFELLLMRKDNKILSKEMQPTNSYLLGRP